jgi:hypothetical protein
MSSLARSTCAAQRRRFLEVALPPETLDEVEEMQQESAETEFEAEEAA